MSSTKPILSKQRIDFTDEQYSRSGVCVEYVKKSNTLNVHGWYDTYVGIEGSVIGLREFLDALGVPDVALRRVLKERQEAA